MNKEIINIKVQQTQFPEKVEATGYIVPVPYKVVDNVMHFVGVELKPEDLKRYVSTGEGRLDLDYIVSIRPYKNCIVDDKLRAMPKFIDDPCLKEVTA